MVCLALAGCGSGGDSSEGGTLRGTYTSFPDSLDPVAGLQPRSGDRAARQLHPAADLRAGERQSRHRADPGPGAGRCRRSTTAAAATRCACGRASKYSDGTPVRASDFRFAIERLFRLNSPGSTFYTGIVGAEQFAKTKKGGITGIEADDASGKIVIHLTEPSGTFCYVLALPFAAPLPPDTPIEDQTRNPPPATGPYVITDGPARPRLGIRAQSRLGERQRPGDAGLPRRSRRQDRLPSPHATRSPRSTKSNAARSTG